MCRTSSLALTLPLPNGKARAQLLMRSHLALGLGTMTTEIEPIMISLEEAIVTSHLSVLHLTLELELKGLRLPRELLEDIQLLRHQVISLDGIE